jgi:toxin ParE1/3/4
MPIVVKRPKALGDLAQIWDYIADDSEERADAFIATIDAKFQMLSQHPTMGRLREELAPGLRSFPVGRYLVFYVPLSNGVDIVRVLHGARDIANLFQDDDG